MRVALVHSFYSAAQPSGENVAVEMQARALGRAGHDVVVVDVRTDDVAATPGYALRAAWTVASGRGRSPAARLREFAPDIVHVHNLFPNFGTQWLDAWGGPVVATLHNFRPLCAAGTLFRDGAACVECPTRGSARAVQHACYRSSAIATVPLALATRDAGLHNAILRRADRVVVLTQRSRDTYVRHAAGFDSTRTAVVPNFVDAASRTTGAGPWVFVGRLDAAKGIVPAIAGWPRGKELLVVGDGPDRAAVEREASGRNVTLVGAVRHSEVLSLLGSAKGLIFPSQSTEGGMAMVYVEALAAGVPVVASRGNSVGDDVDDHGAGVIADALTDLGDAVSEIESNWPRWSEAARGRFEAAYTETAWVAAIEQVYRDSGAL